jgi:hypothetical protein
MTQWNDRCAGLLLAITVACGSATPPAAKTVRTPDRATPRSETWLVIDQSIVTTCRLPQHERETSNLDFENGALRSRSRYILEAIAACMTVGPLKRETVTVVGQADREATQHDRWLGLSCAVAARDHLAREGVSTARINVVWADGHPAYRHDRGSVELRVGLRLGNVQQ